MPRKPISIAGLLMICLFSQALLARTLTPTVMEAVAG
jgi:hypothetical protein